MARTGSAVLVSSGTEPSRIKRAQEEATKKEQRALTPHQEGAWWECSVEPIFWRLDPGLEQCIAFVCTGNFSVTACDIGLVAAAKPKVAAFEATTSIEERVSARMED